MAPMKTLFWLFFASTGLAFLANAVGLPSLHAECKSVDSLRRTEWIRGVPKGCRLVSLHLGDRDAERFDRTDRVSIVWEYVSAADRHDTIVLIDNVLVLNVERQADQASFRVIVALMPWQADRLKVAAACGGLQMSEALGHSVPGDLRMRSWNIHGIEDRTQAIEAGLVSCADPSASLERPTLAAEPGGSSRRSRRVITVPVQLEFQR